MPKQGDTEYTIRSLGWFLKPDDIREIPVGSFNGQVVPLKDVAEVRDSHSETRLYTSLNGQPAVGVINTKQSGANTVTTAAAVHKKTKPLNNIYPGLNVRQA